MLKLIKGFPNPFLKTIRNNIITRKLHYGQGGTCQLNLTNRNYKIEFQTIWQDHCELQIVGLTGSGTYIIEENQNISKIDDSLLQKNPNQIIEIKLKIPEDYTFLGSINGSVQHIKNHVSGKLRSNKLNLKITGNDSIFSWQSMESPSINIENSQGTIKIKQTTFEQGQFSCQNFESQKVLFSNIFSLQSSKANIRSIVAYGNAVSRISSKVLQLQSLSGRCQIDTSKLKLSRLWGNPEGIKIKVDKIEELKVETGTGVIECNREEGDKIVLGKMHKGKIVRQTDSLVKII